MRVRKRLRRIKRLAYLGALGGGIVALRRAKTRRDVHATLGPPATWPPLEPSESPVAAVGDLWASADPLPSGGAEADTDPAPSGEPEPAIQTGARDQPVAAVGDIASDDTTTWVASDDDGGCPLSHPVKANNNSGIYHLPGGQFYERTQAERCYADAAAAEDDGYRAAKSS